MPSPTPRGIEPPPRTGLTPRQRETRDFIKAFEARERYSPTLSEIAAGVGVKKTAAHALVSRLVERGLARRRAGHARSVTVLELPAERDFSGAA